jgi:uncharacterized protein (DUF924 family)
VPVDRYDGPEQVLEYWFGAPAATPEELKAKMLRWYRGGVEMDDQVTRRFGSAVADAVAGNLASWLEHPKGRLALIVVLDQFTRNVLRDSARMYDGDARAQSLAMDGIHSGKTRALPLEERNFALMPLLHAENIAHQERAVVELEQLVADAPAPLRPIFGMGVEQSHKYRDVILRFGRFPHRNAILGRVSTPQEAEFLRAARA